MTTVETVRRHSFPPYLVPLRPDCPRQRDQSLAGEGPEEPPRAAEVLRRQVQCGQRHGGGGGGEPEELEPHNPIVNDGDQAREPGDSGRHREDIREGTAVISQLKYLDSKIGQYR